MRRSVVPIWLRFAVLSRFMMEKPRSQMDVSTSTTIPIETTRSTFNTNRSHELQGAMSYRTLGAMYMVESAANFL
eukprot:CAMPEP_0183336880 /NCGR_PEP_ID=MMETSP0164_2-20130417/4728_1 /TAXON_ID=221442 /ORGANISM="Coccolithus pelagicus ssp braarudi, Strain PLY182g" /LENGTH=74 /DNA_ID=CAMNT_0025506491 /DNA_START=784 /DNA_END=1008 /DNA_ORIENTATION=+